MTASCLYLGEVMHHRLAPMGHRFRYRVASLLIDLDELPKLGLRLLSHNRRNLFSVHDADLALGDTPKAWISRELVRHGILFELGAVRVHLFPRLFGFGFNPLTTWFCHHKDGRLGAVLYEVHNTFGERHGYLMAVDEPETSRTLTHAADKCFHVSPFMDLEGLYRFALRPPGELYAQVIRETDRTDGHTLLIASHIARRQPLTDRSLLKMALAYPLLPLKIVGGIHWEALKLWLKGARFHRKPAPPTKLITLCRKDEIQ
jgi:hypothetical protein